MGHSIIIIQHNFLVFIKPVVAKYIHHQLLLVVIVHTTPPAQEEVTYSQRTPAMGNQFPTNIITEPPLGGVISNQVSEI